MTQHLIFLTISVLQQKIENLGKMWAADLTIFILLQPSQHLTQLLVIF